MNTYKGYVLDGAQDVRLAEFPFPECAPDQVIIKNRCAAICGGDISSYKLGGTESMIPPGSEFGHEMVSDVVAVGSAVEGIEVGMRVYPYPTLVKADLMRSSCLGGFSEYLVVENARLGHNLYLVDDAITDVEAALIEPFTVGFHAVNMMNPRPEENAIVYGAGTIGVTAAIRLREVGCPKVAIVERSRLRCEIVEKLGIKAICNRDEDWKQQVLDYFGPTYGSLGMAPQVGIIVDAVGSPVLFKDIQELTPIMARISLVAIYHQPCEVDLKAFVYGVVTMTGTGGYTPLEVEQVMDVMRSKRWDVEGIVTQAYSFEDFPEAMEVACDSERSLKVIVNYE